MLAVDRAVDQPTELRVELSARGRLARPAQTKAQPAVNRVVYRAQSQKILHKIVHVWSIVQMTDRAFARAINRQKPRN